MPVRLNLFCFHSCTAFICLLVELFGTTPSADDLTGVAIDRGIIFKVQALKFHSILFTVPT